MKPLSWFPERVPPSGALTATGLRGVLGRPRLHPLTILVRETAQNSWDARLSERPVEFSVHGFDLSPTQLDNLRTLVFAETPAVGLDLRARLRSSTMRVLVIRDSNTHGLGGPTRADSAPHGGPNRYVRFLLDVGAADRQKVEGGTYGFGRSIAYNVSSVHTVVVYTRSRDQLERPQSRLIAAGLGEEYSRDGQRFTGRHWWGRLAGGTVEPLVDSAADDLAAAIGFPLFRHDETGTALMILDPVLFAEHPERAMGFIAESIAWHLWPKMIPTDRPPMRFTVSWNGSRIPVPDPTDMQPLTGYVRALEAIHEARRERTTAEGVEVIEVRAERPKTTLGWLALCRFPYRQSRPPSATLQDDGEEEGVSPAPFTGRSSHVVLLRSPELVVIYDPHVEDPNPDLEWAGVFLAADHHNEAFAESEPPTHDAWEPGTVEDRSRRRIVNIALRRIREHVKRWQGRSSNWDEGGSTRSVARIANELGTLFSGVPGAGGRVQPSPPPSPPPKRSAHRPEVNIVRSGPVVEGGQLLSEIVFRLVPVAGRSRTSVEVTVGVVTGDGNVLERDARPIGAPSPSILRVEELDGSVPVPVPPGQDRLGFTVDRRGESTWRVVATTSRDVMVAFDIDAEAVEP
jgi:hypothetical protein